jgi:hypothetical protein
LSLWSFPLCNLKREWENFLSKKEQEPNMVKVVISFIIFTLSAIGGKLAFDALLNDPEAASFEESKWRNREYLGINFESPFELSETEIEIPKFVKPFVKYMNTYKYDSKAVSLFVSKSEYIEDIPTDIDGALKGAMLSMRANEDVKDFDYQSSNIYKNFLEGRRAEGKFKMNGKDAVFTAEFYKSGSKLIQVIWSGLDFPENREIGERIFQSVRIKL